MVAGLHGPPDDYLVCVQFCRQSQQLGSDVTVGVNEGDVDVVIGGATLQLAAQRLRPSGCRGVVPSVVEGAASM